MTLPKVSVAKQELSGRSRHGLSRQPLRRGTEQSSAGRKSGCKRRLGNLEVLLFGKIVSYAERLSIYGGSRVQL
ncbi:Hypothetical predicted protein [Podarcis lilfordi]|uniref:Uncharacterized protein n=1 Tax=Podarcis lilfordi TaxID=74358 RepID=A0AA35P7X6_9SAUR|nr:Hypothetical predicted protein [Podarcis lilfordi]